MIGLIINQKEVDEIIYLLKREMDELLFDLKDDRISHTLKKGMDERYDILYNIFKRMASPQDCLLYLKKPKKVSQSYNQNKKHNKIGVDK